MRLFECLECNISYKTLPEAFACCKDEEFFSASPSTIPVASQHICQNVTHGNKTWLVWLDANEECPMCDFIYRP
jgi:hypothetical protein